MTFRTVFSVGLICLLGTTASFAQNRRRPERQYPLTEDSKYQDGVPKGEVKGPFEWKSEIYPGTVRNYWVYVPQQYDESKKTPILVLQDGLGLANGWQILPALDNLINSGEIPVQLGIFIDHGIVPAPDDNAQPRFNRSYEYDSLGDRYARFLEEEILPEVAKTYNISDDPNDRAIGGASSGAICAFNVAWERPDMFRRVLSTIGTYTGLRGADAFPILVRKFEPKPIRVFLQDGSSDLDIYAGDWWIANQGMLSALQYAGYEVEHAWGKGGHNSDQASSVVPDALRFLWKDYPEPIAVPVAPSRRMQVLIPDEGWEEVSSGHGFTEGPAVNAAGEFFFTDIPNNKIHRVAADGTVSVFIENSPGVNGLMFGPDGKLYACQSGSKKIVRYDEQGNEETVVEDVESNDLVVLADGSGYFTDPGNHRVWRFTADGQKSIVDEGIAQPNGIIVSPDQTLLTVADTQGRFTYSFQIQADGTLGAKQTYGWLHLDDRAGQSGADGMTVDTNGNTYVTTSVGVQILDQLGRVNLILDKPQDAWLANAVFAGPEFDTLYVTCGDKVYRRKLNAKGVLPFQDPVKPPRPGL